MLMSGLSYVCTWLHIHFSFHLKFLPFHFYYWEPASNCRATATSPKKRNWQNWDPLGKKRLCSKSCFDSEKHSFIYSLQQQSALVNTADWLSDSCCCFSNENIEDIYHVLWVRNSWGAAANQTPAAINCQSLLYWIVSLKICGCFALLELFLSLICEKKFIYKKAKRAERGQASQTQRPADLQVRFRFKWKSTFYQHHPLKSGIQNSWWNDS